MRSARLWLTLTLLALTPVLAGCIVFKAPPKGKQIDADTVRVKFTVCASSSEAGSTCPDLGNVDDTANEEFNVVLLGFRVPIGTGLPDEIKPVSSDIPGVLRRTKQYGRVLNDEAPTPRGFEWVGYRSAPRLTPEQSAARFKVDMGLPPGFGASSFRFRPVVGYFAPDAEHPADSPIVCGLSLFDRDVDDDGDRTCIDSPTPDETATHISVPID
jgi:hypothetical protein